MGGAHMHACPPEGAGRMVTWRTCNNFGAYSYHAIHQLYAVSTYTLRSGTIGVGAPQRDRSTTGTSRIREPRHGPPACFARALALVKNGMPIS